MTLQLKHAFTSTKPDDPDATLINPSDWNAGHAFTMASGYMLGRVTALDGAVEELTASQVKAFAGLGNVDNTADAAKPVSTAQQTALNLKANTSSPVLTGNPTAPTQAPWNGSTRLANTAYVDRATLEAFILAASDEVTAIVTGSAKVSFRMPYGFTLTGIRASLSTASSSGGVTIDVKAGGVSILSTLINVDATQKTSTTAGTQPVIGTAAIADDAEVTVDITAAGTGAKGVKVYLIGRKT